MNDKDGIKLRDDWLADHSASFVVFCKLLVDNGKEIREEYFDGKLASCTPSK